MLRRSAAPLCTAEGFEGMRVVCVPAEGHDAPEPLCAQLHLMDRVHGRTLLAQASGVVVSNSSNMHFSRMLFVTGPTRCLMQFPAQGVGLIMQALTTSRLCKRQSHLQRPCEAIIRCSSPSFYRFRGPQHTQPFTCMPCTWLGETAQPKHATCATFRSDTQRMLAVAFAHVTCCPPCCCHKTYTLPFGKPRKATAPAWGSAASNQQACRYNA